MVEGTHLTSIEAVHEDGSWLCTVEDEYGTPQEVLLVPCEDGVEAWINRCTHEAQRLDTGRGAAIRDGEVICPKHGSLFDACTGYCDNGEAADTTLAAVDIAVDDDTVYLTDDGYEYQHDGPVDDDTDPSTSHIGF